MTKKIIVFLVVAVLAYLAGVLCPIQCIVPNIDWGIKISSGELFYYSVSFIQAIATIAAVIVALFSETIKEHLRKPVLEITLHNVELIEELESNGVQNKKAKRYHNSIDIFNKGNGNVDNCEICIESILFKGMGASTYSTITDNESHIFWNSREEQKTTYIPVQGKKNFPLYEILPPEEQATPGGGGLAKIPPRLKIGEVNIPEEYCGGEWLVNLCLYSPCMKPIKFSITISWNGAWENRQMEMKNKVSNTIEILKS